MSARQGNITLSVDFFLVWGQIFVKNQNYQKIFLKRFSRKDIKKARKNEKTGGLLKLN